MLRWLRRSTPANGSMVLSEGGEKGFFTHPGLKYPVTVLSRASKPTLSTGP